MNQFKDKNDLDQWIDTNFPVVNPSYDFGLQFPDMKAVAKKLAEDGYDLENLTANGEGYEIDGHTNNGWTYVRKSELSWLESVGEDLSKYKVRDCA